MRDGRSPDFQERRFHRLRFLACLPENQRGWLDKRYDYGSGLEGIEVEVYEYLMGERGKRNMSFGAVRYHDRLVKVIADERARYVAESA
ncbi:hypothetical protein CMI42_03100 [Candidatus Pacearchaeota archaeon]|nr:hypothetical protein [Candidatus Pacearchaeota archaeon]|tara:strand:- start:1047 stop:1313 length:267 start_codon:yes stop_codon:yes gene_type:complete